MSLFPCLFAFAAEVVPAKLPKMKVRRYTSIADDDEDTMSHVSEGTVAREGRNVQVSISIFNQPDSVLPFTCLKLDWTVGRIAIATATATATATAIAMQIQFKQLRDCNLLEQQ